MSAHLSQPRTKTQRAVADWFAESLNRPRDARRQWADGHVALLALGRRFSAVRLTSELVHAVAVAENMTTATTVLRTLDGPVIHDPRGRRFYALMPPSPPAPSLSPYATHLGLGHYIGVPRVGDTEPHELASYWSVPMRAPGALCDPSRLAGLISTGMSALTPRTES